MKLIIMPVIVIVCILAGGAGGHFLKSQASKPALSTSSDAGQGHGGKKESGGHGKPHQEKTEKASKSGGHGQSKSAASGEFVYFKFSREFVVPIMREERVKALVIININLEVDENATDAMFSMEPKLRDNIMTTLVGLSNDGVTLERITSAESYETIRSMILMNLNSIVTSEIKNVLILDVAKQDL